MRAYLPLKFGASNSSESRDSRGGGHYMTPSRARIILRHSPVRVLKPRITMVSFILLCDVGNMSKYAFQLSALSFGMFDSHTEERNVV